MALPKLLAVAVFALFQQQTTATFWSVIDYEAATLSIDDSFTFTRTVSLNVPSNNTPTASPTSTSTSVNPSLDVTYITKYYAPGAIPQDVLAAQVSTRTPGGDITITEFYQRMVYTAPASCSSRFTFTTSKILFVPRGAETQLSPTSTSTSVSGTATFLTAYLTPSAVPTTVGLGSTTTSDYIQSLYINSCSNPSDSGRRYGTSTRTGSAYTSTNTALSGGFYGGDPGNDEWCLGSLCPFWLIYIVVIIPVVGFLFLAGFAESYFWFARLMQGGSALRGVPISWIMISLWTLCCLRTHKSALPDQRERLQKQWREMPTGRKVSLWLKYGFRHRDPPELGTAVAAGVVPGQQPPMQQQPMYYPNGPGGPPPAGGVMYYPPQQPGQPPQPYYPNQQQHPVSMYTNTSSVYSPSNLAPQQVPTPNMSPPPQGMVPQPYYPPPPGGPASTALAAPADRDVSPISPGNPPSGQIPEQTHAQPVEVPGQAQGPIGVAVGGQAPAQGGGAGGAGGADAPQVVTYQAFSPQGGEAAREGGEHGPVEQVAHGPGKTG